MRLAHGHTEDHFIKSFKYEVNQELFWKYFIKQSQKKSVNVNEDKLKLLGFKFYSTKDACDDCFKELYDLQNNPSQILDDLLPEDVRKEKIPFQILFHAKKFYYPGANNFGGTTLYYKTCSSTQLSQVTNITSNDYENQLLKISHQEAIHIPENKQDGVIVIKINEGEDGYIPK